jgi:hypothetical protein
MIRFARLFTRVAMLTALVAAMPATVSAAGDEPTTGVWMAASGASADDRTNVGRLILKDGVLSFQSTNVEWTLAVSDIKRVAISEESDRLFVLESVSGETYFVAILGQNLLVDSPRRAMQVIQRVARAESGRRER